MVTIREVAVVAGVSPSTVSHVINDSRIVSSAARQRVEDAMQQLGYRRNTLARSRRRGETQTLGLIFPDSANPYFAEIGRAIEAAAFQQGYGVILCNTEEDPQKEKIYTEALANKRVDGMIFVAAGERSESLSALLHNKIPFVVVDRDLPDVVADTVLTDNCLGGESATRHLIEGGHRRIGCITGPFHLTPSADRATGFRSAIEKSALSSDEMWVVCGDFHPESGYQAASSLLRRPDRPTAIFACNDLMAFGVLCAANEMGLRVPDDLAVVGYDDIELSSFTVPPLTSVAQPKQLIGQTAIRLLLERIQNPDLAYRRVILPTELVVRKSSRQRV